MSDGCGFARQGQKCSRDELTASAFLTVRMDDSMDKAAVQVRNLQWKKTIRIFSLRNSSEKYV